MPTNQLAPLVSTTRINLAGNSFQVIMEMEMVGLMMVGVGLMMVGVGLMMVGVGLMMMVMVTWSLVWSIVVIMRLRRRNPLS